MDRRARARRALIPSLVLGAVAAATPVAIAAPGDTVLVSRQTGAAGAPIAGGVDVPHPHTLSTNGNRGIFQASDGITTYVRDVQAGTSTAVSVTAGGGPASDGVLWPNLDGAGNRVVFQSSDASMVPGISGFKLRIFVRDIAAGTTSLVSSTPGGADADDNSLRPSISRDGRYVSFTSFAPNLGPQAGGFAQVFRKDLAGGGVVPVSRSTGGALPNENVSWSSISADGRFVVFMSKATNLDPADTTDDIDLFLRDIQAGTTTLVTPGFTGTGFPAISDDGSRVAFASGGQVYVRDIPAGTTTTASATADGAPGTGTSSEPSISADGRYVAFSSDAQNFPSASPATTKLYRKDLGDGSLVPAGGAPTPNGNISISGDGCFTLGQVTTIPPGFALPAGIYALRSEFTCAAPGPGPGPPPGGGPGPAPAGGGAPAPPPAAAAGRLPPAFGGFVVGAPSAKACLSRRAFRIRVRNRPGAVQVVSATVFVNGRRVATRKGARLTAPVDLKGLKRGRYAVKITATMSDGRTVSETRRYRTCARKRR